ncbi:MAG: DNA helicase, partial [SAR86 cluster bacterium]
MTNVMDFDARKQAIDISASYAVQAPAGSGKTELLSLRFLHLLAVSQQPEEVLAITFTKKAANEMAERILSTLDWAASKELSDLNSQFDIDRYNAADKVLQQDKARSWKLRESPHRLRIQTIDSFSSFLANRLPVLSNFGGPLLVSDQIDDCYQEAIRDCLDSLNDESAIAEHIAELLLHFDNDVEKVEGLLLDLLKNRDQWIETIIDIARSPKDALNHLIKNIDELIEESLLKAKNLLLPYENSIVDLLRYATKNLKTVEKPSIISRCEGLDELPRVQAEDLAQWRGLLSLLLTNDVVKPSWRKRITKEQGFPAPSSSKEFKQLYTDKKQEMEALLGALGELDEGLETLNYLRWLPGVNQGDRTWQFLSTLTAILPTLLAQLEIAFARNNKVDYPQVSSAALRALGTENNPTDLALSLDYQIKHILVDEFQDTSSTQLNLLVKLTAGWEADDGRTLFVVG